MFSSRLNYDCWFTLQSEFLVAKYQLDLRILKDFPTSFPFVGCRLFTKLQIYLNSNLNSVFSTAHKIYNNSVGWKILSSFIPKASLYFGSFFCHLLRSDTPSKIHNFNFLNLITLKGSSVELDLLLKSSTWKIRKKIVCRLLFKKYMSFYLVEVN